MKINPKIKEFATERQKEFIDEINDCGSQRKAAKNLGINPRTLEKSLKSLRRKAALSGYSENGKMDVPVPDGFSIKGTSSLYGSDGKKVMEWVKTNRDHTLTREIIEDAIKDLTDDIKPLPPVKKPKQTQKNLCNLYTITDAHVGMLAWGKESGEDWDLKIAEETLCGCFKAMIDSAPDAEYCVINQLGDFLHADGIDPVTPTNKHLLDVDGRFSKVVGVAIRIIRKFVSSALEKHKNVHVILATGNHDITSSIWFRQLFKALYENEPRIKIDDSELPYYVYQHGKTMICFHHGHMKKNNDLPLLFAAQFPKIWGDTSKRYCHVGHRHHLEEKEHSGMKVTQHPTLAARDAYAAHGGWISERQATCITYHSEFGQVATNVIIPEMII